MTVLSGQSIRRLGIFSPLEERAVWHGDGCGDGCSYGLSVCGYDVRVREAMVIRPGEFVLASTLEHFDMPSDLVAVVHDKSTLARMGLAVQNTVAEPGWRGYLTLELTNHSGRMLTVGAGQPIAQVLLHVLNEPAERPYSGKYMDQPPRPVAAIREE